MIRGYLSSTMPGGDLDNGTDMDLTLNGEAVIAYTSYILILFTESSESLSKKQDPHNAGFPFGVPL